MEINFSRNNTTELIIGDILLNSANLAHLLLHMTQFRNIIISLGNRQNAEMISLLLFNFLFSKKQRYLMMQ